MTCHRGFVSERDRRLPRVTAKMQLDCVWEDQGPVGGAPQSQQGVECRGTPESVGAPEPCGSTLESYVSTGVPCAAGFQLVVCV